LENGGNSKNMSNRFYIIVLFIAIFILGILGYWRINSFMDLTKNFQFPEINLPETNIEDMISGDQEAKEWESEDGFLKLQYPGDWIDSSNVIGVSSEGEISPDSFETILFVQRPGLIDQAFAFLTILKSDEQKTIDEVINEIKKSNDNDGETTVTVLEENENDASLEILLDTSQSSDFYSKIKVLFFENKTYVVIFTTSKDNWSALQGEADNIFNSISY
jgi:hypothetical protein